MPERDAKAKLRIYFTIYRLNLSFANIVRNCRALEESGILSPKFSRLYQSYAQELQTEINEEVVGHHRRGRIARHASVRQGEDCEGNSATRTTFSFMPRSGVGNWQDKARKHPL